MQLCTCLQESDTRILPTQGIAIPRYSPCPRSTLSRSALTPQEGELERCSTSQIFDKGWCFCRNEPFCSFHRPYLHADLLIALAVRSDSRSHTAVGINKEAERPKLAASRLPCHCKEQPTAKRCWKRPSHTWQALLSPHWGAGFWVPCPGGSDVALRCHWKYHVQFLLRGVLVTFLPFCFSQAGIYSREDKVTMGEEKKSVKMEKSSSTSSEICLIARLFQVCWEA